MREIVLIPLSWLYGMAVRIRNWLYDAGILRVDTVGVPVVSVGNITTGGTGKTPFVEYLVRYLLKNKRKVVVISRGYKRTTRGTLVVSAVHGDARTSGDEPFQIARKFPGLTVIVDESRVRAANLAVRQFGPDVILLDDGFQHRSLGRDLNIVLIDGGVSLGALLPAGHRREPVASLRRADLLAVTRVDSPQESLRTITVDNPLPVISVQFRPRRLRRIGVEGEIDFPEIKGKRCLGFCGIGNPQSFRKMLEKIGLTVAEFLVFPDHHRYREFDLLSIAQKFENCKADLIVTTEKDSVRLQSALPDCFFLEIEAVISNGENILHRLLDDALKGVRQC